MSIREIAYEGQMALSYETDRLALIVLPRIGGKVISLVDRTTNRELLWREPNRPIRQPAYGASYDQFDISGWDECFPTIAPCLYPSAPWSNTALPDHGELWTAVWSADSDGNDLIMRAGSRSLPYTFERRFQPSAGGLRVQYRVTNTATETLACLWSMHPFFAVSPTTRIVLPENVRVRVELSKHDRLGARGSLHPWPITRDGAGCPVDLGIIGPPRQDALEKLYTEYLPAGWAAMIDEANGQYVAFTFDRAVVPFVGMAVNRDGWPFDGVPSSSLILEPCTGWPDRLDEAVSRGAYVTIPAGEVVRWHVDMHVGSGETELSHVIALDGTQAT